MEELHISRGNAHSNLRELVSWGLVRSVFKKGDRKEYFEAEKHVWKIFCTIIRERRRRELRPAMAVLEQCADRTKDLKSAEARRVQPTDQGVKRFSGAVRQRHHQALALRAKHRRAVGAQIPEMRFHYSTENEHRTGERRYDTNRLDLRSATSSSASP